MIMKLENITNGKSVTLYGTIPNVDFVAWKADAVWHGMLNDFLAQFFVWQHIGSFLLGFKHLQREMTKFQQIDLCKSSFRNKLNNWNRYIVMIAQKRKKSSKLICTQDLKSAFLSFFVVQCSSKVNLERFLPEISSTST